MVEAGNDDGSGYWIGIDLGTCFSVVAVWQNNRQQVIQNHMGGSTTQSAVQFRKNNDLPDVHIGKVAMDNLNPNHVPNTIFEVKRLIGSNYDD